MRALTNCPAKFERIFVINLPSRTDHRDGMILAAASSNIALDWVDGVRGEDVPDKALPLPASLENMNIGNIGSWRAHLNAMAKSVRMTILFGYRADNLF
jgi:hypothetical protein